jgi:hypothetical protein
MPAARAKRMMVAMSLVKINGAIEIPMTKHLNMYRCPFQSKQKKR